MTKNNQTGTFSHIAGQWRAGEGRAARQPAGGEPESGSTGGVPGRGPTEVRKSTTGCRGWVLVPAPAPHTATGDRDAAAAAAAVLLAAAAGQGWAPCLLPPPTASCRSASQPLD